MDEARKHKADLILIGAHPHETPTQDDDEPDPNDGLHAAMEDLLKAIEAKDTAAMVDAFKAADKLCEEDEGEDEAPTDDEG